MPRLFVLSAVFLVLLLTHSHSLVPRISTLSSHQSLPTFSHHPLHHDQSDSPHHPCCATPFSPPRLRCLIRAASSSLPHPRCLTLAVSSSLLYPRCKSSPQLPIFAPLTLLTLINRPLQVLLSYSYLLYLRALLPSVLSLLLSTSCLPRCLLAEQVPEPCQNPIDRLDARNPMQEMRNACDLARETSVRVMQNSLDQRIPLVDQINFLRFFVLGFTDCVFILHNKIISIIRKCNPKYALRCEYIFRCMYSDVSSCPDQSFKLSIERAIQIQMA